MVVLGVFDPVVVGEVVEVGVVDVFVGVVAFVLVAGMVGSAGVVVVVALALAGFVIDSLVFC